MTQIPAICQSIFYRKFLDSINVFSEISEFYILDCDFDVGLYFDQAKDFIINIVDKLLNSIPVSFLYELNLKMGGYVVMCQGENGNVTK